MSKFTTSSSDRSSSNESDAILGYTDARARVELKWDQESIKKRAIAGNAKKAEVAAAKKAKADQEKEKIEAVKWQTGAKDESRKQQAEAKRLEALAKKAEREAMLAEEEAQHKKAPLIKEKKSRIPSVEKVPEYSASGLDAAMELMDLATMGKNVQDKLERHPEKRVKSAYAAFEERELPRLKAENPGLRLSQFKQMLQKQWKKSPENPLNQAHIAYDTSKDDAKLIKQTRKEEALEDFKS